MYICCDDLTYVELKTLKLHKFTENDKNAKNLYITFFIHKLNNNMQNRGVTFWPQVPFS